jgi:predicted RNA-binding protein YlqC (UPF0109 family)
MRELLDFILKALVRLPDEVKITEETEGDVIRFKALVAQEDRGRVIGKKGQTADAVRTVMNSAAGLTHQRVTVEFVD